MSRTLISTDQHTDCRGGSKIFLELMRQYYLQIMFPYIIDNKIENVIFAGDFFDNRNHVTTSVLNYITTEFIPEFEKTGAHMYIIAGNHDIAYRNTNSINHLGIFKNRKNFTVVDNEVLYVPNDSDYDFVLCPWINPMNYDDILADLKRYESDKAILIGHFEIAGMKMYKFNKTCEHGLDKELFSGYHKVLSGHFHHASESGNFEYLGAQFHLTWADYDDWRGFRVYNHDDDTYELVENDYCLFTQMDYHRDFLTKTPKKLKSVCENQIVRLTITEKIERVELEDAKHKIDSCNPISLDIEDRTLFEASKVALVSQDEIDSEEFYQKQPIDYLNEKLDGNFEDDEKEIMTKMFNEILHEASEQIRGYNL